MLEIRVRERHFTLKIIIILCVCARTSARVCMCVCRCIYNKACIWRSEDNSEELLLSLRHGIWGLHSSCTRSKHFYLLSHLTGPEDPFLLFIYNLSDMEDVGEQKVGCSVVEQMSGTPENKYIKRKENCFSWSILKYFGCWLFSAVIVKSSKHPFPSLPF